MELTEIPLPPDFTAYGNGNALTLSLSLRLGGKDRSVRWAVPADAAEKDRYHLRIPVPGAVA
jgi:hypothetical protein